MPPTALVRGGGTFSRARGHDSWHSESMAMVNFVFPLLDWTTGCIAVSDRDIRRSGTSYRMARLSRFDREELN